MNSAGFSDWVCVRERRPFVQHLTNAISASFQADVINALGGRCMMSLHPEEVGAIAARADALLINIGAPDADSSLRYRRALDVAQLRGIPVVLDPVGYGFTPIRSEIIDSLLKEYSFSIIRGNGGEIALLAGIVIFSITFTAGQEPSKGPGLVFITLPAIFYEMGTIGIVISL